MIAHGLASVSPDWWLPGGLGLVGVLVAGVMFAVWRSRTAERRRIRRIERRLSVDGLRELVIPDGIGGVLHVDRLLLTHRGVLVLDLRAYPGTLFGSEHIEQWTQVTRGGSFRFPNPLHEGRLRVQALRALLPGVPVQARVVFTGEGWFVNAPPDGVSRLETLEQDLGLSGGGEVAPAWRAAWDELKRRLREADHPGAVGVSDTPA